MRFGDPDHDRVQKTKTGQALKRLGPHDLVTSVHRFENQDYHLGRGSGQ